jgi:hypothetical protein
MNWEQSPHLRMSNPRFNPGFTLPTEMWAQLLIYRAPAKSCIATKFIQFPTNN